MPQSGRRQRLPQVLAGSAVAVVLAHLYGLYRPSGPTTSWFPYQDKLQHALGFAAPVALILLARYAADRAAGGAHTLPVRFVLVVVGIFALHGVVSELVQHVAYVHRTGDPVDVLADWLGVAAGWAAARAMASRASRRSGRGMAADLPMPR
jgi:hypothetical protein